MPGGLVPGAAKLAVTLLQHVVLLLFLCQCQAMEENHDRPIPRDDLLFTVEMALRKASRLWPRKRVPGDHDRLKPAAAAVVAHLELCGVRCFRRSPAPRHSTPDTCGALRQNDGKDGLDDPKR